MQYSTLILDVLHFLLTPFNVIQFEFFPLANFKRLFCVSILFVKLCVLFTPNVDRNIAK